MKATAVSVRLWIYLCALNIPTGTQFACLDVQLLGRILIKVVYATSSVHEDFGHLYASHDRADHQREPTSLDDMIKVVVPIEGDRALRPS